MRLFHDEVALRETAERSALEEAHRLPDSCWRASDDEGPDLISAVADARERLAGERRAIVLRKIEQAANCRDRFQASGWPVPQWARAWLKPIESLKENDETENLEDALSALSAALR
jgi:hypothetical protein